MARIVTLVVVLGAAACGGGGGGGSSGTVGTPGGSSVTVTGTFPLGASSFTAVNGGATCQASGATFGMAYTAILGSDQTGICGYLQRGQEKASVRSVGIGVIRFDASSPTATLTPGTYPVVATPGSEQAFAVVQVTQNDASCSPSDVQAIGGTVVVTSVAGGEIRGTVDATLSDGGKVNGTFDAPACAVTFGGDACAGDIGPVNPTCAP